MLNLISIQEIGNHLQIVHVCIHFSEFLLHLRLHMEFEQLLNALKTLFGCYDGLKLSLESLLEKVINPWEGARELAEKINEFGTDMRWKLSVYVETLKGISTAIEQADFKKGIGEASTALATIRDRNNEADGMLKALEAIIAELQKQVQKKSESSTALDSTIEQALHGASQLVKDFTLGLFGYIKKEINKALDDEKFSTNAGMLQQPVKNVKDTVAQVKSAGDDNIEALGNIVSRMTELCEHGKCDEASLKSLKSNAEAIRKLCDDKLLSLSPE